MAGSTTYYIRLLDSTGTPLTSDTGQQWFDLSAENPDLNSANPAASQNLAQFSLTGLDRVASTLFSDAASSASLGQIEIAGYNGSTLVSDNIFGDVTLVSDAESNTATSSFTFGFGQVQQTLYTQSASGAAVQQSQSNYDFATKAADYSAPVAAPANNVPVASAGVVPTQSAATLSFKTAGTSSGTNPVGGQPTKIFQPVTATVSGFSLSAYSFGTTAPLSAAAHDGTPLTGAGKVVYTPLTLTFAASDQGVPALAVGTKLTGLDITDTASSASGPYVIEDYQFKLLDVTAVSTDQTGAETVTFSYGSITDIHHPTRFVAPLITVPSSDQPQVTTGIMPVTPFAGASISDAHPGATETVTVTPSSTTGGTLSDPNAATDNSTTSNGAVTLTGSASTVTTDLDALTFTPVSGQFGTTAFSIADTNSAGLTSNVANASVTVLAPSVITVPASDQA